MAAVLLTNVVGYVRVIHAFLPLLERSSDPRIVNVSSGLGSFALAHDESRIESRAPSPLYAAAKSAINMLTVRYAQIAARHPHQRRGPRDDRHRPQRRTRSLGERRHRRHRRFRPRRTRHLRRAPIATATAIFPGNQTDLERITHVPHHRIHRQHRPRRSSTNCTRKATTSAPSSATRLAQSSFPMASTSPSGISTTLTASLRRCAASTACSCSTPAPAPPRRRS